MQIFLLAFAVVAQQGPATTAQDAATNRSAWARCVGARALERSYGPESGDAVLAAAEADCRGEERAVLRDIALASGRDPDAMGQNEMLALGESITASSRPMMVSLIRAARLGRARAETSAGREPARNGAATELRAKRLQPVG